MEQVPQDEGPQREPMNEWLLDTLEEIKNEAVRHFPQPTLQNLGNWVYANYGDSWRGVQVMITLLQKALFTHYRHGCAHSRIGHGPRRR
uniref:Protein Vpr n=1 Tax=Simian immunodeficiency virus TaxID=11723 RepID=A0A1Z3GWI4_SIV|nr:vpr protein [Simian immunodeficiency virus]ASC62257.1 vpr protein [Simian immunodeficiency virus]ASC62264.1 vpr protein [Simian immunodeficiency virus]ASC62271.1 vpr protein [Simian immunodeficiency virus]ASC62278.1 vpr protein [Simian immunodeficiency virus]